MNDAEFRRRAHAVLRDIMGPDTEPHKTMWRGAFGDATNAEVAALLAAGAEEPLQERIAHGIELFKISNRCPEVRGDAHFAGDDAEARKAHPCRHPVIISKRTGLPLSYCGRPKGHAGPHME